MAGVALAGVEPHWGGQINAGRGRFSKRRFDRSAEEEPKKHYMINEVVPSAVTSVNDIPSAGGDVMGLKDLPCFGCRAHLVGWCSVADEVLRAGDWTTAKQLFQAARTWPIRVRVAPS